MNFQEAESYLLSLGNEVESMKLGLENICTLLTALGNPETNYLKVQVAGTNGKGSVCAFLDSICLQADIKTGVFTSPHLISITERVRIDGNVISKDEFARIASLVRETSDMLVADGRLETVPTYFEQVTAVALVAFREAKIDLAILETGLGGRFDATTAAKAEFCAITRIDLDHQEYLGDTVAEIAAEKAAIVHAGTKVVVVGEQDSEAMIPIIERCVGLGVEITSPECPEAFIDNGNLILSDLSDTFCVASLGLAGRHQIENAWVSILLAKNLRTQFAISDRAIESGLEKARHPGRLEYRGQFLFDGAHNPSGARALREYLDECVSSPITLIFGSMKEKNVQEIAGILFPIADKIVLTRPSNSRALTAEDLIVFLPPNFEAGDIIRTDSVSEAITAAEKLVSNDGLILVTGSLYLVGEVRKLLDN